MMYEYVQIAVRKTDIPKVIDFLKKDYEDYGWDADLEYDEIRGSKVVDDTFNDGVSEEFLQADIRKNTGVKVSVIEEIEVEEE